MKKKVAKVEKAMPAGRQVGQVEKEITTETTSTPFSLRKILVVVIVIVLLVLGFYKKNWIIAATINGSPITFLEVLGRLNQDFKSQALDQLINEKIIFSEAKKKDVQVNKQEVNKKISEIEGQVGGTTGLDSILSQQGQTRKSLEEQIKIQLMMEKLYSNELTVSSNEVDTFIKESGSFLQSTDSAKQREEAEKILRSQKLSQVFAQKFQEIKQQAKIQIF